MNRDCGNREERLASLLYEEGDVDELAGIRAHLATCAECRAEFERLTSARELLAAWPNVVNAPRMVYVNEPVGPAGRTPVAGRSRGWDGVKSFLPSFAAAAAVVLVLAVAASFLRVGVGSDGRLRVGFGASAASAAEPSALVTKGDLDRDLAQTVAYLQATMRTTREQDRQALLAVVDQTLRDQNAALARHMTSAVDSAFEAIDQRRRADLKVMLSSMNDLQVITGTELQRISAVLASATPTAEQE